MVDEPTLGEALRRLHEIREDVRAGFARQDARLDKLVTNEAFLAEQRRVDERMKDIADDVVIERDDRSRGDAEQQKQLDKLTNNLRWLAASIVIPIALFLATILLTTKGAA